jgi:hypothetical protein
VPQKYGTGLNVRSKKERSKKERSKKERIDGEL